MDWEVIPKSILDDQLASSCVCNRVSAGGAFASLGDAGRFIILAFIPALIALTIILVVRRLNDIGWSRWLTLLYFVPWIQLIFVLILFFKGSAPDESSSD